MSEPGKVTLPKRKEGPSSSPHVFRVVLFYMNEQIFLLHSHLSRFNKVVSVLSIDVLLLTAG